MDTQVEGSTGSITLGRVIERAQGHLLRLQNRGGWWVGELEADVHVTAGYLPWMHFMGVHVAPERVRKIVNYVRSRQGPDGSWSTYPGGPGDLSVTIQAYFALKLAGVAAGEAYMEKAREFVFAHGGLDNANTFTKIWLALFGQWEWQKTPVLPPEMMLLPSWSSFSIYDFASWSRATIIALMIVMARRPVCNVPEFAQVQELRIKSGLEAPGSGAGKLGAPIKEKSWSSGQLLRTLENIPLKPLRGLAIKRAERWVVEHQEADGSWGGIMLPWLYSLIALKGMGYPLHHPVISRGLAGLEGFIIEDESTFRLQPAVSPIWDTAWAIVALAESGIPADHLSLTRAARWLLNKEVRSGGDWWYKNPKVKPGCWAFEFENKFYPDIDDTALVGTALLKVRLPDVDAKLESIKRGCRWVEGMQGSDGGWAAFDRDNNRGLLASLSLGDFMTPLDPSSPDVTAHALELLGQFDYYAPSTGMALEYLKNTQQADGSWYGRWGVNYIYGTGLVLSSLWRAGCDMQLGYVREAVRWLEACQNDDGGWGETCQSYAEPGYRGKGLSTPSQTAWALIGLIAAGAAGEAAVRRGINYLTERQRDDGSWEEEAYTGTGFPRAFYLRYDLYRIYFPLLALARYKACFGEVRDENS